MTVSSMIASLEAFEARRHLDQNTNKDVQAMLAHGGVALAMDYNIIVSTEDDKIFLTEQLITTFVNKVLKFELGQAFAVFMASCSMEWMETMDHQLIFTTMHLV
ncbi:hypothetical protein, variant [Sphaeroforma arctica JP610]|uniref:Uncharacterized protein n=1 Tax=Sphaeroforma arctica JP610 TaxID=667725 RepID=A0A0L0FER4_9EUKA|nr:hypothetical protein, variant [Sphaeroforma arctica JP610]KNC74966.1 hypothetical protein, variant [Sphaeroforma arctica JP610]|eukprot:XP_014148868.1 hypothetical protein, variant [Sphaeroforma arctica JP610]